MSTAILVSPPVAAVVPGPRLRSVLALTLIEGRRLITHPAILAAAGVILLVGVRGPGALRFLLLVGAGYFALGIGTLVAANLCASRSRRDGTDELLTTLPLRSADRAAAQLLSVAFPLGAALLVGGVLAMTTRPWAGASVRLGIEPRTIMHGLPDFAQGPLLIAFLGVAGVVLARWFGTAASVPIVFGAIVAINWIAGLTRGPLHWLNPAAEYSQTHLEPASVMPWHLAYLVGLIMLMGLVALARRPRAPGVQVYGAAAVALTALGGVMQVLAASP
ncbi:MAG: hypothetical protein ACJ77A_07400 [Actinomycetota bacterium]